MHDLTKQISVSMLKLLKVFKKSVLLKKKTLHTIRFRTVDTCFTMYTSHKVLIKKYIR